MNKYITLWLVIGAHLFFNAPISAIEPQTDCHLKVAWSPWEPYMSGEKTPAGTQIDLLKWVAEDMKCELLFTRLKWGDSLTAIKAGDIDLVGRASYTQEREKYAFFSNPYRESIMVLYLRKGTAAKIQGKSLEDLLNQGFVIGMVKDAFYGKDLEEYRLNPKYSKNFVYFNIEAGAQFEPIIRGEVDGIFEAPFAIDHLLLKHSGQIQIEEYPLELVMEDFYFMFSKKSTNQKIVQQFNLSLAKIKQTEKYKSHWFWSTVK